MLLDTNIVSAFLKRDAQKKTPKLFEFVVSQLLTEGLAISHVTQFELRRGLEELALRGQGRRWTIPSASAGRSVAPSTGLVEPKSSHRSNEEVRLPASL
jgi:predicted nucleic acid-binding protein